MEELDEAKEYIKNLAKTDCWLRDFIEYHKFDPDKVLAGILKRKLRKIRRLRLPRLLRNEIVYYVRWYVYGYNIMFMNQLADLILRETASL